MKVFITGIKGFIGSNIARYLSDENHQIFGSVSEDWKLSNKPNEINELFLINLNESIDKKIFDKIDVLIHCAYDCSPNSMKRNINGTIAVSEAAKNSKQIFISSFSAHNKNATDYGMVKTTLEKYFLEEGHIIIRPGLVVGSGGLFLRICNLMKKYPMLPLLDGGKGMFPILSIKDLEVSISKIIKFEDNGIYNLFNDDYISLYNLLFAIRKKTRFKTIFIPIPSSIILIPITLMENFGVKLPISKDNIRGFVQNQKQSLKSDLNIFVEKEHELSVMIAQVSNQSY